MSNVEMIFLILMLMIFACNILSFLMLLTLSTEIDRIDIHVDFIDMKLKEFVRKYDQAKNEGDQL